MSLMFENIHKNKKLIHFMKKASIEDAILFENDTVLAINKPSGISTLEDRSDTNNVLSKVRELHPEIKNCHRLDKSTSGVL